MFARIAQSEPHFKVWLEAELSAATEILISNAHEPQIRQAQGRAQQLRKTIAMLTPTARRAANP